MPSKKKKPDFEQALSDLETLVNEMEKGDMSLEESLKAFESGVALTRECQTQLASAEQRVQMLIEQQGQLTLTDFEQNSAQP